MDAIETQQEQESSETRVTSANGLVANQLCPRTNVLCSWCGKNESDGCSVSGSDELCADCADELMDDNKDCVF